MGGSPIYGAPFNTFFHGRSLSSSNSRVFVVPNVDTLYSTAWLDLRAEPFILHIPRITNQDRVTPRYYSIQMVDAYTYNFAIVGSRTTGNNGQKYLIAGPSWQGDPPLDMKLFRSKTDYVYLLGRIRAYDDSDARWVTWNIQPHFMLTGHNSRDISPQYPAAIPTTQPARCGSQR